MSKLNIKIFPFQSLIDFDRINTYTQLTDIEQEVNGVYTYDRKSKFNIKHLKGIFGALAAIEKSIGRLVRRRFYRHQYPPSTT